MADGKIVRKRNRVSLLSDAVKKENKREVDRRYAAGRIAIGCQIQRWNEVKTSQNLRTNADVAKFLLDHYLTTKDDSSEESDRSDGHRHGDRAVFVAPSISTPSKHGPLSTPQGSEMSGESSDRFQETIQDEVYQDQVESKALPMDIVNPIHSASLSRDKSPQSTEHQLPVNVVVKCEEPDTEVREHRAVQSLTGPDNCSIHPLENISPHFTEHQLPVNVVVKCEVLDTEIREHREALSLSGLNNCSINALDVAIEVIEDDTSSTDSDSDSDGEINFDVTIGTCVPEDVMEISFADEVYGFIDVEFDKETEAPIKKEPVSIETEAMDIMEQTVLICYRNALLDLARHCFDEDCQVWDCSSKIKIYEKSVGSALSLTWVCDSGHIRHTWCTQPVLRTGLHAGDLLTSAGILCSGNDYQKIKLMAQFMKMPIVSETTYDRIEKTYLVPSVEQAWQEHQQEMLRNIQSCLKEFVILGDGCVNSEGHCAQYCTYTSMDNYSKEILSVVTVDDKEIGNSSIKMEKEALHCTLKQFQDEGFRIKEVITDDDASVAAYMRKKHPNVKHSIDVWHAARNIAKRIMKASRKKDCGMLREWCGYIVNHFYHTCQVTKTVNEFIEMWFCVLHGPLSDEDTYNRISKDSFAHDALRSIVADKKLLINIPSFLSARNTTDLDEFNNLLLLYAGKQYSYTLPVYRARNLLAAMDHNVHLNREPKKHTNGMVRMHKVFNKTSRRWTLRIEKEKKSFSYIDKCFKYAFLRHSSDGIKVSEVVHQETRLRDPLQ